LSQFCDRRFLSLALIGALVAVLALAGCGRKGPLDPPPAASVAGEQGTAVPPGTPKSKQPDKHFPLDPLLN
jgi:predicted small lipoprotein YifL